MATPYSGDVPAVVIFRVSRAGEHVKVRVWIGQEGAPGLTGELTMRKEDWRPFRACLREYDPSRFSIHYTDEAFCWLSPGVPVDELPTEQAGPDYFAEAVAG